MTPMAKPDNSEAPQTTRAHQSLLTDELLTGFAARARRYDEQNTFFAEDFQELREAGYLRLAVPRGVGRIRPDTGRRSSANSGVSRTMRPPRRSPSTCTSTGRASPPTSGAPATRRSTWLLQEAARGQVFAAGHAESGNDIPVLLSTTKAERVDGGYRFTGRKSFGSLTPVWTYLGIHGMDTSDPAQPKIVHAFMPRDTKGYRIEETWDVLGMRATRSDDTILEGAVVPDRYIGAGGARRSGRDRRVHPRRLRVGASRVRQHLLRARAPGARSHRRDREEQDGRSGCRARWPTTRRCSIGSPTWALRSKGSNRISNGSPATGRPA